MGSSRIRKNVSGGTPGARYGWGLTTVHAGYGNTISIGEARRRLRTLSATLHQKATAFLEETADLLVDQWKENIAAEGWGGGTGAEELASAFEQEDLTAAERGFTEGPKGTVSTGRYYNSIRREVDHDLEIHIGSTIPRPSGRGLKRISYPEALEFGTSVAEAYPTLRPALDEVGPTMEKRTQVLFRRLLEQTLIQGM